MLDLSANCICVFVYLHVRHWGILFLRSSYHYLFKNIAHVRSICKFDPNCICVFVCLCILYLYFCICMFDTREYHFWYPWTILFSKICHMMGLYGTVNMLYLCICVFVFVYLCMRHLVISVLISLDQELSENVWFVWSKTS